MVTQSLKATNIGLNCLDKFLEIGIHCSILKENSNIHDYFVKLFVSLTHTIAKCICEIVVNILIKF